MYKWYPRSRFQGPIPGILEYEEMREMRGSSKGYREGVDNEAGGKTAEVCYPGSQVVKVFLGGQSEQLFQLLLMGQVQ